MYTVRSTETSVIMVGVKDNFGTKRSSRTVIASWEFVVKILWHTFGAKENFGKHKFKDDSQVGTAVTMWQTTNQKDNFFYICGSEHHAL